MGYFKDTIDKLNFNIKNVAKNKKARRIRTTWLVFGWIFTILGAVGLVTCIFLFAGVRGPSQGFKTFYVVLLMFAGLFLIIVGIKFLLSACQIAYVKLKSQEDTVNIHVNKDKNFCDFCGTEVDINEHNCHSCGAPIQHDNKPE